MYLIGLTPYNHITQFRCFGPNFGKLRQKRVDWTKKKERVCSVAMRKNINFLLMTRLLKPRCHILFFCMRFVSINIAFNILSNSVITNMLGTGREFVITVIINNSPSLAVYTLTNVRVLPNPNAMQKLHSYIGCIHAPSWTPSDDVSL